ncbi:ATP phosphoribosyltransferase [Aquiluna sp. KACHI24]|uniref:ATP phosphoribosyltransferase n=1 Tax=Aquiluna sp. KACHI24 TaxID=2968831 RepID=UPI0022069911|nr:ATP phosphoribosyltransferase [Aquiluna sp. KACHI24]BDQ00286.1 ATP phosphoribosyltransferase [Aquiluna sp. KACHI24]
MLRVAVPNKGILSESAISMLREAGYATRRDTQELHIVDDQNQIEFFYLRPRDIATYVGEGSLDAGLTGLDLLRDSESKAEEVADLGFGGSTFRFAAPVDSRFSSVRDLQGKRLATAYPKLIENYLAAEGVTAQIVKLDGAVESAVRLGVADAVADVVSTGNTLRKAGLSIFGPVILSSTARLIAAPGKSSETEKLLRRIQGVIVAREYVIFDYDCPKDLVAQATAITPGIESPTISPLADDDWVAVRALVKSSQTNQVMDQLYELGARAILVSAIHAARI